MRRSRPPTAVLALAMIGGGLGLIGCSVDETTPPPWCSGAGSLLIVAQSVPTASQVPCFDVIPDGWSVDRVSVGQDGTVMSLDSDRAGDEAAILRFERSCSTARAISAPSEHSDTERFEEIRSLAPGFDASRFYRFDGGCVTWMFRFDEDASATEAVALGEALDFVSRRELNEQLRMTFIDEEL